MQLTLEERERHAYVEGRTGEAAVLALAIDSENDAIDEMRHERDVAKEEADDLYKKNEQLEEDLEVSESRALTLQSQLENAQDEAGTRAGKPRTRGLRWGRGGGSCEVQPCFVDLSSQRSRPSSARSIHCTEPGSSSSCAGRAASCTRCTP